VDDGRKTGFGEHNVRCTTSCIGSTLNSDTDVGTRKSGSIVGTVTSHRTKVTEALDTLDDLKLVLGEDTGETIGVHDHLIDVLEFAVRARSFLEHLGRVHMIAETEASTSLLSNGKLVTGNHLDLDTESHSVVDGLLGVGSRGVEDGQQADELEAVTLRILLIAHDILESDSERTETTSSELLDICLELVLHGIGLVSGAKLDDDTGHSLRSALDFVVSGVEVRDFGTFVDRVEGLEVEELDALASKFRVGEGADNAAVNGVLVLCSGRVCGEKADTLNIPLGVALDVLLVDRELVRGKGTGLVGTKDGNTCKLLDSGDSGNNSLVLGELLSTHSEGDGEDCWHGNGNTTDQKHQNVVETTSVGVAEVGVKDEDLEQDEGTDRNEAK